MTEIQEYPKWVYQGTKGTLVNSEYEEFALGEGYTAGPTEDVILPATDPRVARVAELEAKLAESNGDGSSDPVKRGPGRPRKDATVEG